MFFLLRLAFWLSIVLVLVPSFVSKDTQHGTVENKVNASDAISAASATLSDLRQFCTRQPDACAIGAQAASEFGQKAQVGARILYEYLQGQISSKESASEKSTAASSAKATDDRPTGSVRSRDTLTPTDLAPTWRVPMPRPAPASRGSA
jgi:hypothetical protein